MRLKTREKKRVAQREQRRMTGRQTERKGLRKRGKREREGEREGGRDGRGIGREGFNVLWCYNFSSALQSVKMNIAMLFMLLELWSIRTDFKENPSASVGITLVLCRCIKDNRPIKRPIILFLNDERKEGLSATLPFNQAPWKPYDSKHSLIPFAKLWSLADWLFWIVVSTSFLNIVYACIGNRLNGIFVIFNRYNRDLMVLSIRSGYLLNCFSINHTVRVSFFRWHLTTFYMQTNVLFR